MKITWKIAIKYNSNSNNVNGAPVRVRDCTTEQNRTFEWRRRAVSRYTTHTTRGVVLRANGEWWRWWRRPMHGGGWWWCAVKVGLRRAAWQYNSECTASWCATRRNVVVARALVCVSKIVKICKVCEARSVFFLFLINFFIYAFFCLYVFRLTLTVGDACYSNGNSGITLAGGVNFEYVVPLLCRYA